jgi:hypothetical protein
MAALRSFCFALVAVLCVTWTRSNLVGLDRILLVAEESQSVVFDGPSNPMISTKALPDIGISRPKWSHSTPPRILLGIFTTNSTKEANRRKLIRKTYLSYYHILAEAELGVEPRERICSLAELIDRSRDTEDCQIVYTFVMGASTNTTVPTDLTTLEQQEEDNYPYVLDRSGSSDYERDVLYLNIQENMNEGKTATWFKYASSVLPATDLGVLDLVFKVDSDTVVVPRALLQDLNTIQRPARNVYGGVFYAREEEETTAAPYMQGGFYFLSTDVAERITSPECPRADIIKETTSDRGYSRSEDREVGNFVARCWHAEPPKGNGPSTSTSSSIQTVFVNSRTSAAHARAYKDPTQFRIKWKERLATDMALLRRAHVQEKYRSTRNGCPPTKAAAEEEMAWFDRKEKMKLAKQQFARLLKSSCGPLK